MAVGVAVRLDCAYSGGAWECPVMSVCTKTLMWLFFFSVECGMWNVEWNVYWNDWFCRRYPGLPSCSPLRAFIHLESLFRIHITEQTRAFKEDGQTQYMHIDIIKSNLVAVVYLEKRGECTRQMKKPRSKTRKPSSLSSLHSFIHSTSPMKPSIPESSLIAASFSSSLRFSSNAN
jgi:hypothetical protein